MPILDPSLQFFLINNSSGDKNEENINFFLKYLLIASRNKDRNNLKILKAYIQFKKHLKESQKLVSKKFDCILRKEDFENISINDYYEYLFDNIVKDKKFTKQETDGRYYICTDQFCTKLYRPFILFPQSHAWFLSDTPIAVLCINSEKSINETAIEIIKLEIDLMEASGFTLVLCANCSSITIDNLFKLIQDNQFSEVHLNIFDKSFVNTFFDLYDKKYVQNLNEFKGYFYLYSHFMNKESPERKIYKDLKDRPRFKIINFSGTSDSFTNNIKLISTDPFPYCMTGFNYKYIRIRLSNVPLYDKNKFTPLQVSGLGLAYINPAHFLKWPNKQIKILFEDPTEKDHLIRKYVNFEDIHKMRPYLYTKDPLSLANTDDNIFDSISKIQEDINDKINQNKGPKLLEFMRNILTNKFKSAAINYTLFRRNNYESGEKTPNFSIYRTQLFTAYEAYTRMIEKKMNDKEKGIIYQVETGEGKSLIVNLIAAAASKGKTIVHIASSNINLSNRDFRDSYGFFQQIDVESAVLLHDNELPIPLKNDEKEEENNNNNNLDDTDSIYIRDSTENMSKQDFSCFSNNKYYGSKCFKNTSKMNFSVCGYDFNNNEKIKTNKVKVIFSTFVNFECFYLRMLESFPGDVDSYFNNCLLLIDEADSILIDEITNGTIISRPMNSNIEGILKFVYKKQKEGVDAEHTYEELTKKDRFKKGIGNLQLEDVKQMYDEIETVNQEDFCDGKKYVIESFKVNKKKDKFLDFKKLASIANFGIKALKQIKKELKKKNKKDGEEEEENDDDDDDDDNDDDDDDDDDDDYEEEDDEDENENNKKEQNNNNNDDDKNENKNDDDDQKKDKKKKKKKKKTIKYRYIVPFDFDHKGIVEPNKEFSGFVQQFIAIKESEENHVENMIIKGMTMSYLYISHPLFVKLYGNVCGFTGTVGNSQDKKIYKEHYFLDTMKIPRQNPNQRVDFPMILCDTKQEKYDKIVSEIMEMHKNNNPVLVIFQDRNDIFEVRDKLNENGISYINIFDGKDDLIKPDFISGIEGAISLGTNVCGRGTDIVIRKKPLHVIIGFYSDNTRVMNQAFGRTGRKGEKGTSRVICLKSEFHNISEEENENELQTKETTNKSQNIDHNKMQNQDENQDNIELTNAIKKFEIKNEMQREFIKHFRQKIGKEDWLFTGKIEKQTFDKEQIEKMRRSRVNVNRIVAFNYIFPIRMTVETFHRIQIQKIYSIINCPNSVYTWRLFRRYVRELILETWSLVISEIDNKYDNEINTNEKVTEYEAELKNKIKIAIELLDSYFPERTKSTILPSSMFMHIFNQVKKEYKNVIFSSFKSIKNPILYPLMTNKTLNKMVTRAKENPNNEKFFTSKYLSDPQINKNVKDLFYKHEITETSIFSVGLLPFSLLSESGARISFKEFSNTNFIKDPELSYERRTSDKGITLLSITEKVDEIFNKICQKVSSLLGKKTYLKLFLRRTLCGGEFGICLNTNFIESDLDDPFCLIDKDSIALISLKIKSIIPILSGILIIFLVYVAFVAKKIFDIFVEFPKVIPQEALKKSLTAVAYLVAEEGIDTVFDKIADMLKKALKKQLKNLNANVADILELLVQIFDSDGFDMVTENAAENVTNGASKFIRGLFNNIKVGWKDKLLNCLKKSCLEPVNANIMKISALIMLNLAAFMLNFAPSTSELKHIKKNALKFNNEPTEEKADQLYKEEEEEMMEKLEEKD